MEITVKTNAAGDRYVREFEDNLRRRVRDLAPIAVLQMISSFHRTSLHPESEMFSACGPHVLAWIFEATCAYSDVNYTKAYTNSELRARLYKLVNFINSFADPYVIRAITTDPSMDSFFRYAHRTQFEFQENISLIPLTRMVKLFGEKDTMRSTWREFEGVYGCTPVDWIRLTWLFSKLTLKANGVIADQNLQLLEPHGLAAETARKYLGTMSISFDEIGRVYKRIRHGADGKPGLPPWLWSQQRLSIITRPAVRVPGGVGVPFPSLFARAIRQGFHDRVVETFSQDEEISKEVGRSFESYVEWLIAAVKGKILVHDSSRLRVIGQQSCDLCVEFDDAIVLIEAKAVSLRTRDVTNNAVYSHTAANEIYDACCQIYQTLQAIKNGLIDKINGIRGRVIVPLVVILGYFPAANSAGFREAIAKGLRERGMKDLDISEMLGLDIQVLDIEAFEKIVLSWRVDGGDVLKVWNEKMNAPASRGDWREFLSERVSGCEVPSEWRSPAKVLLEPINMPNPRSILTQ